MISKGNLHGSGGNLARYLLAGDKNEKSELIDARRLDYLSRDPVRAFETLQKVAEANTKSSMPFFHLQIRNAADDKQLTNAQWLEITDREEKRLGLAGQPRIAALHIKANGERHLHVGWFRVDLETMKAIDSGLYKNHLKHLSRRLEKEYGLKEVSNYRQPEDRARAAGRKEVEEARRIGVDDRQIRTAILDCVERTDGGKAFRAALDERGLMLANGDRRDCFVVIDQAGGHHSLNKKLTGYTLSEMRERLGDLDRAALPSVDQARALQREKHPTPEQARTASKGRGYDMAAEQVPPLDNERLHNFPGRYETLHPDRAGQPRDQRPEIKHPAYAHEPEKAQAAPRSDIRATWSQSPTPPAFAAAMHDQGYRLARVSPEEAKESERVHALAAELGNFAPKYHAGEIVVINDRGWTYRLNDKSTGAERTDILKFENEMRGVALPTMRDAKAAQLDRTAQEREQHPQETWHGRPMTKGEDKISRIQEMAERGGASVAAGLYAEGLTLARVDKAGKADVERDYMRQVENARLQDIREGTHKAKLRPAPFKEGELVAVNKWGDVQRLNPRFIETDRLERDVTGGRDKTPTLSAAREHFATERQQQKDDRATAREIIKEARETQRGQDRIINGLKGALPETARNVGKVAFKVVDGLRTFGSVASFVESLFGISGPPSLDEQQQAPRRRSGGAGIEQIWEEIYEAVQKGQSIPADSLRHMPPAELENLRSNGDAIVNNKIMEMRIEKENAIAQEWEEYDHDRYKGGRER